ncbi:MAG: hypothetical protein HRU19_20575 [Pseudobacteriovorax sp.]|nr:hypothetical protein [Pseudobacteriovorax sp.]
MVTLGVILVVFFMFTMIAAWVAYARTNKIKQLEEDVRKLRYELTQINHSLLSLEQSDSPKSSSSQLIAKQSDESSLKTPDSTTKPKSPGDAPPKTAPTTDKKSVAISQKQLDVLDHSKKSAKKPLERKSANPLWAKIQQNWTGVLGAIIFVLGVSFFGFVAGLYIGPEGRFGLIILTACCFQAGNLWLRRFPSWKEYGSWLQGISGTIILVACLGASWLPGLKFVDSPLYGLLLLMFGVLVNHYYAFRSSKQTMASFHVILSMVSFMVAPSQPVVLMLGAAVAIFGVFLSFRQKWDWNLLVILIGFFVFHQVWTHKYFDIHQAKYIPGAFFVILLGVYAGAIHYRQEYQKESFRSLPFFVHLLNWSLLAINISLYSTGSQWTPVFLGLASVACFAASRFAKHKNITWIYLTDTLIAELLAVVAISQFYKFGFQLTDILLIIFSQSLIFVLVVGKEKEERLLRIGIIGAWLACLALFFGQFLVSQSIASGVRGIVAVIAILGFHLYGKKHNIVIDSIGFALKKSWSSKWLNSSLLLLLAPYLLMTCFWTADNDFLWATVVSMVLLALLKFQLSYPSYNLYVGSLQALWLFALSGSYFLIESMEEPLVAGFWSIVLAIPIVCLFASKLIYQQYGMDDIKNKLVYAAGAFVLLNAYVFLKPIYVLLPCFAYLFVSILALELARFFDRSKYKSFAGNILHIGYLAIALVLFHHVRNHLSPHDWQDYDWIRSGLGLAILVTLAYWLVRSLKYLDDKERFRHPSQYFIELFLATFAFTAVMEVDRQLQPLLWSSLSLMIVLFVKHQSWPNRLEIYSWFFLCFASVQLSFVFHQDVLNDGISWYRASLPALIAVFFLCCIAVLMIRAGTLQLKNLEGPDKICAILKKLSLWVTRHQKTCIIYPPALGVASFLFFHFDREVLTFLWMVEILVLYCIGLGVREKHFIKLAYVGILFCIGRLVFYDLSQADLLAKAGVCVGMGGILLAMNALQKRFRDRIDS